MAMLEKLQKMDTDKLVDIAKNYKHYNYEESVRDIAVEILAERGFSTEELVFFGKDKSFDILQARTIFKSYRNNAIIGSVLYFVFIFLLCVKPTETNITFLSIGRIGTLFLYSAFLLGTSISIMNFYKALGQAEKGKGSIVLNILGFPIFIVVFFYYYTRMKEELSRI